MASQEGGRALLHLYRRLLRSSATYPSRNRWGIYKSIQEEFRENVNLNPDDDDTKKKVAVAYKGLQQLQMYDTVTMGGGDANSPNWEVTLEQNPMPKPSNL